jgi:catechol 2,3-dioxygenase-like lactoylglutathione lyase family enzyme
VTRPVDQHTKLRFARATDSLEAVTRFYVLGLGLQRLASFTDHDGFDGVMVGVPGAPYHLEFTRRRGHPAGRASTQENLLVFYLPDATRWNAAVQRMAAAGFHPVASVNPYWGRGGATFEDPDGYRVVLYNGNWTA